jgi:hypothetical protein
VRTAGRRSKLTPEVQKTIADILRNCGPVTAACGRAQIDTKTFYSWLLQGEAKGSGPYYEFLCAVRDAKAQATLFAVRTVRMAIAGGAQGCR